MAVRFLNRRARRLLSSPKIQLLFIGLFLLFGIRWVIRNNHNDDAASHVAARPTIGLGSPLIEWDYLQYVQFVTAPESLCSSVMMWSQIERIGSRGQRVMYYPSEWDFTLDKKDPSHISLLLEQAKEKYFVKLHPLDALNENNGWAEPYTNLLAFNLTQFRRVLVIEHASVIQRNLDDLFVIPNAPLAMPYVYYGPGDGWQFSKQSMLVTPSNESFASIEKALKTLKPKDLIVDMLTKLFHGSIIKLPQRTFALQSGEYRRMSHDEYIQNRLPRTWHPDRMLNEARILHFSDYPLPKPWVQASQKMVNQYMPKCRASEWFGTNCRDRTVWLKLYSDYAAQRKEICGKGFEVEERFISEEEEQLSRERHFQP